LDGSRSRQAAALQQPLAPRQLAGLPGCLPRLRGQHGLLDADLRHLRVLLEELKELLAEQGLGRGPDGAVTQLGLGLTFELRVHELDADDRRETFPDIIAAQPVGALLEVAVAAGVVVQRPRQRVLEADEVSAALDGVDVVGESVDALGVAVGPLHRDLDADVVALPGDVDRLLVQHLAVLVQVLDELHYAAVVAVDLLLLRALVLDLYLQPFVEEGELAKPDVYSIEIEDDALEYLRVRLEAHCRPMVWCCADLVHLSDWDPPLIPLGVKLPVLCDLHLDELGQSVHDAETDPVQASRNTVGLVVELAAGVQLRHDDLQRRLPVLLERIDGDPSSVILHGDDRILADGDFDVLAEPDHRLVDRVVDDFVDEMMKAVEVGASDVHPGPFTDGFEAFEDLDLIAAVGVRLGVLVFIVFAHQMTSIKLMSPSHPGVEILKCNHPYGLLVFKPFD